jgi:hypothetical protein
MDHGLPLCEPVLEGPEIRDTRHGGLGGVVLEQALPLDHLPLRLDHVSDVVRRQGTVFHDGFCEDLLRLHERETGEVADEGRGLVATEGDLDVLSCRDVTYDSTE